MKKQYSMTIGLEIHTQVDLKRKLFSSSKAQGCDEPNQNVSFFDLGLPGTLPILNEGAVKKAIRLGLAIDGHINKLSYFDRKHYFYPDVPLNYQITQFYNPIVTGGYIDIGNKKVRIHHFHIETDAGKMVHSGTKSYIDFNRVGVTLFEIVTEPDIKNIEEFKKFIHEIILRLQYAEVSDCNMELGNFRMDVNISVSDSDILGTRVEIKNLNSVKFAIDAINYEYNRQVNLLMSGGMVDQETRGFNSETGETFIMRSKVDAHDYGYMPDGNLGPVIITNQMIDKESDSLPEMPHIRRKRYQEVGEEVREVLIQDRKLGDFFDKTCNFTMNHSLVANFLCVDLMSLCKKDQILPYESKVTAEKLGSIIEMLEEEKIVTKIAKYLIEKVYETGMDPVEIVSQEGLVKISDRNQIRKIVEQVIAENPQEAERCRNGDDKLIMFFLGKVIKITQNRADPKITQEIIRQLM